MKPYVSFVGNAAQVFKALNEYRSLCTRVEFTTTAEGKLVAHGYRF